MFVMTRFANCALYSMVALFVVSAMSITAEAQRSSRRSRSRAAEARGTLVIEASLEGAEVFVDDELVGTTPLDTLSLAPGAHTVRVRLPGHTEFTDVVRIAASRSTRIAADLFPLSEVLSVTTEPEGAHVYVDGNFMGETPVELELLEGTHSLRLLRRGFEEVIRQVDARPGHRDELRIELVALPEGVGDGTPRPTEWYEEPLPWIGIGGGAVAIAVTIAIVVVVTSSSSTSQLDQFCAPGCIRHGPSW